MERVLIVGARRHRQGIGEFLAHAFSVAGAEVVAVVGTTPETSGKAQTNLFEQYGIQCAAYTSLATALEQEEPDIVAICTPFEVHHEQLKLVLAAGAHCLCEKPIIWEMEKDNISETNQIVDGFIRKGRYLSLVTQWPYTLASFYDLFPQVKKQPVTEFEMSLSPIRPGLDMILDATPHLLSMLQTLVGDGKIQTPEFCFTDNKRQLVLTFDYKHNTGKTAVKFTATVCEEIPRPASYSINGNELSREIELPDYTIWFKGNGKRVPVDDPLILLVTDFLKKIKNRCVVDRQGLITSIEALDVLYQSAMNNSICNSKTDAKQDRN